MAHIEGSWKKVLYLSLIIFALFIFDNTLVTFFSIKGVYPSILFVFIICYSIINGYEEAVIIGVIAGALQDLYFPGVVGANMLVNMLLCLLAARIGKSIFKEKIIIPVISTFLLSILKSIIFYFILILIDSKNGFLSLILYKGIYETIIAVLIYKIVLKFCETKIMKKEWRF